MLYRFRGDIFSSCVTCDENVEMCSEEEILLTICCHKELGSWRVMGTVTMRVLNLEWIWDTVPVLSLHLIVLICKLVTPVLPIPKFPYGPGARVLK